MARTRKQADNYVNYQERALGFAPGDVVVPFGSYGEYHGRVIAVYPAIGMADVEFPTGAKRYPVEDLQRVDEGLADPPYTDSSPGGHPTALAATRVAHQFLRTALYWGAADRRYKATRLERETGRYFCPKCKDVELRSAVYKRRGGKSERLLGCPRCMFLVKKSDIIGHPENAEEGQV